VSPVRYEVGFYIPEDDILSHSRENFEFYILIYGLCNAERTVRVRFQALRNIPPKLSHQLWVSLSSLSYGCPGRLPQGYRQGVKVRIHLHLVPR
jgi:hypothetical protein